MAISYHTQEEVSYIGFSEKVPFGACTQIYPMLGLKYPVCLCTDCINFVFLNCTIVIRLEFFNIDV